MGLGLIKPKDNRVSLLRPCQIIGRETLTVIPVSYTHLDVYKRQASDFDYEKTISQLNHIVGEDVETFFLISKPEFSHISSTIVREIIKGGGNAKPFLPEGVQF